TSALPALAEPVHIVSTDERGITLEVTVGAWSLTPAGPDGRARLGYLPGSHALIVPGRPQLPAYGVTLALPPDGRPSARLLSSTREQAREGVRLEVSGRPIFRDDPDGRLGPQPAIEPVAAIADGPWPASTVDLGQPFGFRGRRLAGLDIRPFRYDE